jgi:predicted negative regulator of RcsB-dependent stress response
MSTEHEYIENQGKFNINQFYLDHKRNVNIGLIAVVVLIAGWVYYAKYYLPEQNEEAAGAIFMAQRYFEKDSFNLTLNGDGKNLGVIDIADQYGNTKTGNLAKYYAGRSYMGKGDFKTALEYLEDCKFHDEMMAPLNLMLIGDCQVELEKYEDASANFMKAGNMKKNNFVAPIAYMKAGRVYEKINEWGKALKAYERIKKDYKESEQGREIDKYIYRAKFKMES